MHMLSVEIVKNQIANMFADSMCASLRVTPTLSEEWERSASCTSASTSYSDDQVREVIVSVADDIVPVLVDRCIELAEKEVNAKEMITTKVKI